MLFLQVHGVHWELFGRERQDFLQPAGQGSRMPEGCTCWRQRALLAQEAEPTGMGQCGDEDSRELLAPGFCRRWESTAADDSLYLPNKYQQVNQLFKKEN